MPRLQQSRRQLIGFVYNPQVQNNIKLTQPSRSLIDVQEQAYNNNMRNGIRGRGLLNTRGEGVNLPGGGIMDKIKSLIEKGKTFKGISEKAHKAYISETGAALRNLIPGNDETARPVFPGETHMILKLPNGKNGTANFMGPGTKIIKRLKRDDPGRTPSDTVAKMHDIDYQLAQTARTRADQLKQVRKADNRMIASLKKIKASRSDAARNITAGLRLIQAKKAGEDLGVLDPHKFTGPLEKLSAGDTALLKRERAKLVQQGLGKQPPLPGTKLKMKMLRKALKKKKSQKGGKINISKSSNGQSRRKGLGKQYKLNPKPIVGAGLAGVQIGRGLAGIQIGRGAIVDILKSKIVPGIVKSIGLPKSTVGMINKLIPKLVSAAKGKLPKIVSNVAKGILPILVQKHFKGKGIQMSGRGIINLVKKSGKSLLKKLSLAIVKALKFHSLGKKGSGLKIAGGGFWSDFAKGFKMVFKPGAKALGAVATALGQPEIGVPLEVVSGLL